MQRFFSTSKTLRRLRNGLFGPYMDPLADVFAKEGYEADTCRKKIRIVFDFGRWLGRKHVAIENIGTAHVASYAQHRARKKWARTIGITNVLNRLLETLRLQGCILKEELFVKRTSIERLVDDFFSDPKTLRRLRKGLFAPYLDSLADQLAKEGYGADTCRKKIRIVFDFGRWLGRKQVVIENITTANIASYAQHRARTKWARVIGITNVLDQLLEILRVQGCILKKEPFVERTSVERLVDDFDDYLSRERALARSTRILYRDWVIRFLADCFADGRVDFQNISAATVVSFVRRQAAKLQPQRAKNMTTALRCFLRYVRYQGFIVNDLAAVVPTVAQWSLATIPRSLPRVHIDQVLSSCNRQTAVGRRDYAILLLLARLGIRGGEVVSLRLEDIDWQAGCIFVRGKNGRPLQLPLLNDVGEALSDYIQNSRQRTSNRLLFLRAVSPARGLAGSTTVCSIVRYALTRAGINAPRKGAHQFRHSLATELLHQGASLAEIGELLGHQDPKTTAIYAKVDLNSLHTLALMWPGGEK